MAYRIFAIASDIVDCANSEIVDAQQETQAIVKGLGSCGKLLKANRGEVAEWLNAAVC